MVLQGIKISQNVLRMINFQHFGPLSKEFTDAVDSYVSTNDIDFKVDAETTAKSVELQGFFTDQKLALAGYPKNHDATLPPFNEQMDLLQKIVLRPGITITTQQINQAYTKLKASKIKDAMVELATMGIGNTNSVKPPKGGIATFVFVKRDASTLNDTEAVSFIESLSTIKVSLQEYKDAYALASSVKSTTSLKRSAGEHDKENAPPANKQVLTG